MVTAPMPRRMSVEDYLALDRASVDVRYEYYDGAIRAMTGGSLRHSSIKVNCVLALGNTLRGKGCRVFDSDARVQITAARYVYPDVTVTCSLERIEGDIIPFPVVVIEVLSPSTAYIDKGRKLDFYRACLSIEEYVLIDSERVHVEVYRRAGAFMHYFAVGPGDTFDLTSIAVQISVDDLYQGIEFPPDEDDLESRENSTP